MLIIYLASIFKSLMQSWGLSSWRSWTISGPAILHRRRCGGVGLAVSVVSELFPLVFG